MAYSADGFRTLDYIGTVSAGTPGTNTKIHGYVTADDAATVETANYFLDVYRRLRAGDQIQATLAISGTPVGRMYVVTASSSTTVTIAPFEATAITTTTTTTT